MLAQLLVILCTLAQLRQFAFANPTAGKDEKYTEDMLTWLRAEGGFFSPKLEMRRADPNDPKSRFGMYASGGIEAKEVMIRVPTSIIVNGVEEDKSKPQGETMECPTIRNLLKGLKLRDESKYAPYVNYLLETQPPGMLPSAWSEAGQELLLRVLSDDKRRQYLPPSYPVSWIDDYYEDCGYNKDPLSEYAALIVIQRSWDDLLLPVYDMMSHRNGHWLNTESNNVHEGQPIEVRASRNIEAGEEIYTTYNLCADCGARFLNYGSPEILRDYGFVESFPQTWIFHDIGIGFRMDKSEDDEEKYELVEWIGEEPDDDDIMMLKHHLELLTKTKETVLDTRDPEVPENEWEIISDYISAMAFAITFAIDDYEGDSQESCLQEGTCAYSLDRYADLDEDYVTYTDEKYNEDTCELDAQFEKFGDGTFKKLEEFKSQYQEISFSWDPKNGDTCMSLDDIVQICDSYRPHYHEMVVHNTARFLPKIERVLFVGGGDSMLLHEILKYPTLELVVGLELDQRVTRGAFKHFGTQPHYDYDKVQWWYGDASKSLLMLPKEYFASFDMVLVDLSETVMSFQVTSELDVLDALTLLLKPSGIFVKNELYFEKFQQMFPHSAQIHWYDNPVICSQALNIGSRTVDFMKPTLTDHGVEGLFIRPLDEIDNPFDLYHDYTRNSTSRQICDFMGDKGINLDVQTRSPGIIMIVEAENVSADLTDPKTVEESLSDDLRALELSVISSMTSKSESGSIITIILTEGYIVARVVPELKYCGFDIHFWSKFEKHEDTKKALVSAIGGSSSSMTSFRVIAGGMFGASSWQSDVKIYGPQYDEICNQLAESSQSSTPEKGSMSDDIIGTVYGKILSMNADEKLKVAMLVGNDGVGENPKSSLSTIEEVEAVKEVVPLSCPTMSEFNEFASDASEALTSCEKDLYDSLMKSIENGKFNALIIDSSANKLTASILLQIFTYKGMLVKVLMPEAVVLSAMNDENDEWRKNFVKRMKEDVFVDEPASYNEILIATNEDTSFTLLVSNEGEDHFIQTLTSTLNDLETENRITYSFQHFEYGFWRFQENFVPSQHFLPDDFNQVPSLEQWKSQMPLGHQVIVQMEPKQGSIKPEISTTLLRQAITAAISHSSLSRKFDMSEVEEFTSLGEGSVLAASWPEGSVTILWDGRNHVDMNLFASKGYEKECEAFELKFVTGLSSLQIVLRDEQPRGIGRVVSFSNDIQVNLDPHWA